MDGTREGEDRWRYAIEGSGDGVWDWNIQTGEAYYSRHWWEMLGHVEGDISGDNSEWVSRIHPDDAPAVKDAMNAYLAGTLGNYAVEYRLRCSDGSYKWILGRGTVVSRSEVGAPLRMVGTHTDITERKQIEESLRKSEGMYHSLVETSQDLIWKCDTEGRLDFLNLAVGHVFGYELSEMLGKKFSDFQSREYAERDMIEFARVLEGESLDHHESVFISKYGDEIYLVVNALFVADDNGNITGVSGTAFDITRWKKLENELLQAKAAAEAASAAKSQFLANMSHELRTPLNSVIGFTDVVLSKNFGPLNDAQIEYLGYVMQSSRHLLDLINDILDLSKIEADKMEIRLCNVIIRDLLNNCIAMLRETAAHRDVKLIEDFDATIPVSVRGDERKLKQIIFNLLSNAIKFSPSGGIVTISGGIVTISAGNLTDAEKIPEVIRDTLPADGMLHRRYLSIRVSDTGDGLRPEDLERIFKPFEQADNSDTREFEGTGLGLSLTRKLLEMHGGTIWAESAGRGQGSTFSILIPA
ncbi:MAG TPA: PAS domain-containing sensor histidine kinase [Desulfuromonadales bacterium]|nr:PAS domain-containing sensor histidine kinase [Desulfuromonadales bacterium]